MANSQAKCDAFVDLKLLEDVVDFKKRFYRCPWAQYDNVKPGTFRLYPPEYHIKDLENDYKSMQSMLFGDKPEFQQILENIKQLEVDINSL